jgi:hypothetical protein
MDITDLGNPINIDTRFANYLKGYLRNPTDFSQANQGFGNMISNPQLFMGPGGVALDPTQTNAAAGQGYLQNRAGISSANMSQKASFADLLMNAGGDIGNLTALMTQLQAAQLNQQTGATGSILGGLGF